MILDKIAPMCEDIPFDEKGPTNTGDGFDLDAAGWYPGEGEPIQMYMTGKNLAGAGPFQLVCYGDQNIDGNYTLADFTITIGPAAANAGGVTFSLPSNISPFIKFGLSGFTAGTFSVWAVAKF